ncbi:MAG: hypothetical protein PHW72_00650 [Candidatus Pacebacteria bacterium]|nr:hypothetical protein [Candidatus Paceibacterota bacterium]
MQKTISPKLVALTFGVLVILFSISFYIFAWQEPASNPPADNIATPLNSGPEGQEKEGGLILNTGGAEYGLIVGGGRVGIGQLDPAQKLDVNGTVKATGFLFPVNAGEGKVLTSDTLGAGSWQAPNGFKGSVLVNYGVYNYNQNYPYQSSYGVSPCPLGWTQAGLGSGAPTYTWSGGGWAQGSQIPEISRTDIYPAYRTCIKTDQACLSLVNYGTYNTSLYSSSYSVPNCPSGWTQAGLGYQPSNISPAPVNNQASYDAYRTCFLCQ